MEDQLIERTCAHRKLVKLMGNRFEITVVSDNEKWALEKIDGTITEIKRIETLLTTFADSSQTNKINKYAGIRPVEVDREVFDLIHRSLKISFLTQGAFDISYGSVDKRFWNFDKHMTSLPDKETAKESVRLINFRNIFLDEKKCTVFLKEKGMRIGFGGIGKGYAAEKARQWLINEGVESGIVNAAGDLTCWGIQPNGEPWTIGIADPLNVRNAFASMNISDMAVATSGNYEKFVYIDGKKYSHTIDPRTGLPVSGINSVTIICKNAEIADALATPVMIMGVKVGLNMINQMKNIGCILVDDDNRIYTSANIKTDEKELQYN
jgi:thiamine biosynthesis lipoprotein